MPFTQSPSSGPLEALQVELEQTRRMLRTALQEVRESRTLIKFQAKEMAQQTVIIGHQQDDLCEWMHAADAQSRLAAWYANQNGRGLPDAGQSDHLAECILAGAKADGRFGHTALLASAMEYLLAKQGTLALNPVPPAPWPGIQSPF